jgi:hypothetical protein
VERPLQILLHPLHRLHSIPLLEGGVEDGLALEAGALREARFLRSRSRLTGRSGADSQITQFLFLVDLKFVTFLYKKVTNLGKMEYL